MSLNGALLNAFRGIGVALRYRVILPYRAPVEEIRKILRPMYNVPRRGESSPIETTPFVGNKAHLSFILGTRVSVDFFSRRGQLWGDGDEKYSNEKMSSPLAFLNSFCSANLIKNLNPKFRIIHFFSINLTKTSF